MNCETITVITSNQKEIVLCEYPQADKISVIQWVFVPAYTVEHNDGAIEFVPSYIDCRRVYPNADEF